MQKQTNKQTKTNKKQKQNNKKQKQWGWHFLDFFHLLIFVNFDMLTIHILRNKCYKNFEKKMIFNEIKNR